VFKNMTFYTVSSILIAALLQAVGASLAVMP
jgi:hypothetical protein